MPDTPTAHVIDSEPRRRSIRLPQPFWVGLIATIAVVAVFGLHFALPVCRQNLAIQAVERLGGKVKTRRTIPEWAEKVLGEKWATVFDDVDVVFLTQSRATDTDLRYLCSFPRLEALWLGGQPITDSGLCHLTGLSELKTLDIYRTRITDAGMEHLRGLKSLETLYVDGTNVTDAGLASLQELRNLRELYYYRSGVSKEGVAELKRILPRLASESRVPISCW
jgi:Leucine-rich repeat (LRR) protein